jgi:hypothetical protein
VEVSTLFTLVRKRLGLFLIGVTVGAGMFLIGGVGVIPAHGSGGPTAKLAPWLQRTQCQYPVAQCTSPPPP